jgi:hypothetical protein
LRSIKGTTYFNKKKIFIFYFQYAKLYKPEREKFTEEYTFLRDLDCGSKVVNAVYVGNHRTIDSILSFLHYSLIFSCSFFLYFLRLRKTNLYNQFKLQTVTMRVAKKRKRSMLMCHELLALVVNKV